MTTKKAVLKKKRRLFSVGEANAMLPLVKAIVGDIAELAKDLQERQGRLLRVLPTERGMVAAAYQEELNHAQEDFERDQERFVGYINELTELGIELKDYSIGLVDFPCRLEGRVIYLCWKLGEPDVSHWHEIDSGFSGRQKLGVDAKKR